VVPAADTADHDEADAGDDAPGNRLSGLKIWSHWIFGPDPVLGAFGIGVTTIFILYYTLHFGHVTSEVQRGYGTSAFDIGLYDQGVWLMSRFKNPYITLMGRDLFGDHTQFQLVALVPFYWIWPDATTLLYAQSFVLALGAVPVYMLAMRRLNDPIYATVFASAFLLHPALVQTNSENFHPDAFLVPILGFLLYAAIENRARMFVVFSILALLCKEDTALIVLPIALWFAWRRNVKLGIIVAIASILSTLFMLYVVIRGFVGVPTTKGGRIPYGGPTGFVKEFFRRPADVIKYLLEEEKPPSNGRPFYVWQMVAPTGLVFLIAPEIALTSILVLATNVISSFGYQHQIAYHYSMVLLPSLAMGTVFAVSKLKKERYRIVAVAIVGFSALWTAYLWGKYPFSVHNDWPHWSPKSEAVRHINNVKDEIPDNAVISVYHSFAPHVAHRERVYMWPTPFSAVYWNTSEQEGQRLPQADDVEYLMLPPNLSEKPEVFDSIKGNFVEVARGQTDIGEGAVLYKRINPPIDDS
jgi:uncharacterized membrane protein